MQQFFKLAHPRILYKGHSFQSFSFHLSKNWWYSTSEIWEETNWAAELSDYENWLKEL
ncbi:MAG: hypothetical protein IKQ31_02250 [Clostridia bacterium]|nr:hypothetical protein [Clostridia bacterium]